MTRHPFPGFGFALSVALLGYCVLVATGAA